MSRQLFIQNLATCFSLLLMSLAVGACSSAPTGCSKNYSNDVIYVVESGWHAEIGIPSTELKGKMTYFRSVYPEAKTIIFGYGKKTFFTAPPNTWSEYLLGPIPGPAVIHTFGLNVTPDKAYEDGEVVTLKLLPKGQQGLSDFIWQDLTKGADERPVFVARSSTPDGIFYAAQSEYTLLHTCNSWIAEALEKSGLPVSDEGVIIAGQVMARVDDVAEQQCQLTN